MALDMKKGFVYTLEAVIASSLMLSMVTIVMPKVMTGQSVSMENVHAGLKSLDKRGDLRDNLAPSAINQDIHEYVPKGFNTTVRVFKVDKNEGSLNAGNSVSINENGNYHDLEIWAEHPSNMDITFDGKTLASGLNSQRYMVQQIDGKGTLSVTGSGTIHYSVNSYSVTGTYPTVSQSHATSYIISENGLKEIKVIVWKK
ncbi:MAG: hypothetical protein ABEJ99_01670 [Candidatus Nanohaloarchaea archaeon]